MIEYLVIAKEEERRKKKGRKVVEYLMIVKWRKCEVTRTQLSAVTNGGTWSFMRTRG